MPLSHDEVVHGKGSLLDKMPGDDWQKFANLRLLYGYMYGHPGKKLLFMGGEFGQWHEWNHDQPRLASAIPAASGTAEMVQRSQPALHERPARCIRSTVDPAGFQWVDCDDADQQRDHLLASRRRTGTSVLVVCNFTPVLRTEYRVGVHPVAATTGELLNTDATVYWGSGQGNAGGAWAESQPWQRQPRPWS